MLCVTWHTMFIINLFLANKATVTLFRAERIYTKKKNFKKNHIICLLLGSELWFWPERSYFLRFKKRRKNSSPPPFKCNRIYKQSVYNSLTDTVYLLTKVKSLNYCWINFLARNNHSSGNIEMSLPENQCRLQEMTVKYSMLICELYKFW